MCKDYILHTYIHSINIYYIFQDLNSVARVSKIMHQIGTDPFLWTNFNLKVKFKKIETHRVLFIAQTLGRVIKIDRLRYLNHIDLCDNDLSSVTCTVLGGKQIISLKHHQLILILFPIPILGIIVNSVEDCDIGYTDLTADQLHHIFEVMRTKTRLKKLNIRGNCLR